VYFDQCYQDNPLVNAMAVGIVKQGQWARAVARGAGNPVMIVGSSTGRDGIHGATFASEELSEKSEAKRPSVQVGDPFTEKLLLEATLEAIRTGHVVGIQDMGAAGITCSTSEMSARGASGMRIDLDRVPAREEGMSAYELMLSESQERMLLVVERGHEEPVQAVFRKWDVHAEVIGEVIEGDRLEISYKGRRVADVPPDSLVLGGGAPVYHRESREPRYIAHTRAFNPMLLKNPGDLTRVLLRLLASPNIASKRWVYEQYDSMVRTNNIVLAQADAALVYVKNTDKALSLTTDCNGRYVYLNPRRGAMIAVAEAARNVVCTGAVPLAITNCLNFGNPYKPEVYWQFKEAVEGIGEACRAFNTPVTGGNVSFYNESPETAVYPTPVIGMLGLVEHLEHVTRAPFQQVGDTILLLGSTHGHLGGSEYLAVVHGAVSGDAPSLDLRGELALHSALLEGIREGLVASAHDCSEGGIAVALAECCILDENEPLGATVYTGLRTRADLRLFGEDQGRVVLSTRPVHAARVMEIAWRHRVPVRRIGVVGGPRLSIDGLIEMKCHEAREVYQSAIERAMEREL